MKQIQIKDKTLQYTTEYRNIKNIRFEISYGKLKITLPVNAPLPAEDYILRKENYLYRKLVEFEKIKEKTGENPELYDRSLDELKQIVKKHQKVYEKVLGIETGRLSFRDTKHKWGSCSRKSNITLSKDLKYLPENLIAYILFHEMVHLVEFNHGDKFQSIIKNRFPDYESLNESLTGYEYLLYKKREDGRI